LDCGKLHGPWKERGMFKPTYVQKCGCVHKNNTRGIGEKWPGFDFNEVATLCYCCGRELLNSGSKWSVWFCDECKQRAINLRNNVGWFVIPIGRHSLMNGIAGDLAGKTDEEFINAIKDFSKKTNTLFDRQDRLVNWGLYTVRKNTKRLGISSEGSDVNLSLYLNLCLEINNTKKEYFKKMCEWFGIKTNRSHQGRNVTYLSDCKDSS